MLLSTIGVVRTLDDEYRRIYSYTCKRNTTTENSHAQQTERLNLSNIARDPAMAAFLARGELDSGAAFAVPASPKPVLTGGAVQVVPEYA